MFFQHVERVFDLIRLIRHVQIFLLFFDALHHRLTVGRFFDFIQNGDDFLAHPFNTRAFTGFYFIQAFDEFPEWKVPSDFSVLDADILFFELRDTGHRSIQLVPAIVEDPSAFRFGRDEVSF